MTPMYQTPVGREEHDAAFLLQIAGYLRGGAGTRLASLFADALASTAALLTLPPVAESEAREFVALCRRGAAGDAATQAHLERFGWLLLIAEHPGIGNMTAAEAARSLQMPRPIVAKYLRLLRAWEAITDREAINPGETDAAGRITEPTGGGPITRRKRAAALATTTDTDTDPTERETDTQP